MQKSETEKIRTILSRPKNSILKEIDFLIDIFEREKGIKVCRSCPSSINLVILTLKNLINMSEFEFKRERAIYKNKPTDKTSISNSTMTDEKAIEFLKTNPERIHLFRKFPPNWKKIINGKEETVEQKEKRLAIEAEIEAAKENKK